MSQELQYTSAPRGLKPGSQGFCTVVCSQGLPASLAQRVEDLSAYRLVFAANDAKAALNPVVHAHLRIDAGSKKLSVLSRIGFAGLDYSQRANKFAHHVLLEPQERPLGGPAWLLGQPGFMVAAWDKEVRISPSGPTPPQGDSKPGPARAWAKVTGDAGWAGVLAESFLADPKRLVYLVYEPGLKILPLLAEAIALLPPQKRWDVTFSTYFTALPLGVACAWRCVLRDSPEAKQARRLPQALVLELGKNLGRAQGAHLVEQARTGLAVVPSAVPAVMADEEELRLAPLDEPGGQLLSRPLEQATPGDGYAIIPDLAGPPTATAAPAARKAKRKQAKKARRWRPEIIVPLASLVVIVAAILLLRPWLAQRPDAAERPRVAAAEPVPAATPAEKRPSPPPVEPGPAAPAAPTTPAGHTPIAASALPPEFVTTALPLPDTQPPRPAAKARPREPELVYADIADLTKNPLDLKAPADATLTLVGLDDPELADRGLKSITRNDGRILVSWSASELAGEIELAQFWLEKGRLHATWAELESDTTRPERVAQETLRDCFLRVGLDNDQSRLVALRKPLVREAMPLNPRSELALDWQSVGGPPHRNVRLQQPQLLVGDRVYEPEARPDAEINTYLFDLTKKYGLKLNLVLRKSSSNEPALATAFDYTRATIASSLTSLNKPLAEQENLFKTLDVAYSQSLLNKHPQAEVNERQQNRQIAAEGLEKMQAEQKLWERRLAGFDTLTRQGTIRMILLMKVAGQSVVVARIGQPH